MKLLQSMLRREVERLASPIYTEYREKLKQAAENEPVGELIMAVQTVASELNHTASPNLRGLGRTLEIHAQKALALYNVDHSHDIAQSWSKRKYDEILETIHKTHDLTVKQSGHSFEFLANSGTRTRTCFVRLRQPFIEVRYEGKLQQYGSDQEVELNTTVRAAVENIRNEARTTTYKARTTPHWTEKAYAKVIGVVGNCKWSTVDSGANEFRFDNPEKKMCVVKIVDGKLFVNYEGQINWYTDETSFLDGMATILNSMEPWANRYFEVILEQVRASNFDVSEDRNMFEFSRNGSGTCIVRHVGNKISVEYNGSVGIYDNTEKLARTMAEVYVKMLLNSARIEPEVLRKTEAREILQLAYDSVKFSLGEFPEVTVTDVKNGFNFTSESGVPNVKLPTCTVHFTSDDRLEVTGYGIVERFGPDDAQGLAKLIASFLERLLATAEKIGVKYSWSQHLLRRLSQHIGKLQLSPNMEKFEGPGSFTIQLKDRTHGFNISVSGPRLIVTHDGSQRTFTEQTEEHLFGHMADVLIDFKKYGKAN